LALVTWAWLPGVLRLRIFCMAIMISTMFMQSMVRASLAGVSPWRVLVTVVRGQRKSTSIWAISTSDFAIASGAAARSMA